jgi:polysaccharide export outer membrane protein
MLSRRTLDVPGPIAALLLGAAAILAACTDGAVAPPPGFADPVTVTRLASAYRLGTGDKLKVSVFGEQDLSGQFEVNGHGAVSMPLIGEVPAKGRTVQELRDDLALRLSKGYLKNPKISIDVVAYRPIYVHGEVKSGGEFQYKSGIRLRDAVAMAGGYTYRAHTGYVLVTREGTPQEYRVGLPSDMPVMPGDNIRVPERMF